MLRILGRPGRLCDGITRREVMRAGGLSLFGGMTVPRLLAATAARTAPRPQGTAKSVILFNLLGGPSHMDMFDMKPLAPVEIRGEFLPIDSSLPGLQLCEHLPNTAKLMHKATVIRTVTHTYDAHNPLAMMTGWAQGLFNQLRPEPTDPPDIGAICQYLGMGPRDMPGAVCMPCYPGWGEGVNYPGIRRPGPYGGFLGNRYDPLFTECNPTFGRVPKIKHYDPVRAMGEPTLPKLGELPEMTADRFDRRRSVLQQLDAQFERTTSSPAIDRMNHFQQRALELLSSGKVRQAFDLSSESNETRERFGRHLMGSSMLTARRLVEAGVPFISVHTEIFGDNGHSYDMHENNFGMLKNENLPVLDMVYPALVEDLESRGLLDSTLVVVMGEMGRSPRVNRNAGRDHWPRCGFSLLTGGGIKRGTVFGSTDKQAAYPTSDPVSPGDVVATIYHLLGIDPHMMVPDQAGRPIPIAHGGEPIWDVIA
ncbi:MAG: DUF1501 domain-containing protein [Planctomycetaceae bacterium]